MKTPPHADRRPEIVETIKPTKDIIYRILRVIQLHASVDDVSAISYDSFDKTQDS